MRSKITSGSKQIGLDSFDSRRLVLKREEEEKRKKELEREKENGKKNERERDN